MNQFINVGFGNIVNASKVVGVIKPEAAPIKRMVQGAKDDGNCIDATCGRKCKSVIFAENGQVILSALLPETIMSRVGLAGTEGHAPKSILIER
ncbi:MAG: DUF370 domain-containing protein [Lachnospiraceae bacterium]|nr:DUF370 domain-containing protein [Lachnospiraceae bacterium]